MDRVAVFVDAGYLFAQGSVELTGKKLTRSQLVLDYQKALLALQQFARESTSLPLLRIYWYDGTSAGPTPQHNAIAFLPDVKLRLGLVNSSGEQKGVDSLIVTDMISLARNRAMADAVLLSGDEDLRVGVQQAQEWGVRVHLLGIRPSRGSQSAFLLQEADTVHEWSSEDIGGFLTIRSELSEQASEPACGVDVEDCDERLLAMAREVAGTLAAADRRGLMLTFAESQSIPREIDARLLAKGRTLLGRSLTNNQKRGLRQRFISECERLESGTAASSS